MMNKIFLIGLFSISFLAVSAQEGAYKQTLRGTLRDIDTQRPVEGATVVLLFDDKQEDRLSDAEGAFMFENVPVGRHDIIVMHSNYKARELSNIRVGSGHESVLEIFLTVQLVEVDEVVVEGGSDKLNAENEMAMVSARSFSVEETERYAGSLGDPSRMAANFAGVMSVSDQRNDIIIRGNSPTGLLWRLEGIEIPNPNHFAAMGTTGGPVSMLNNNLLTNSDFYTGAFPAEFGNAYAGVFDLKMRKGNIREYEHTAQIGFNGIELGTEGPFSKTGKASYLANYRYSTNGFMNRLGFDDGTGASRPEYQDLTFHLNFPLPKGRLSLIGLGGKSYIELISDDGDAASYDVVGADTYFGSEMGVTGLSHVHYISDNSRLHTTFSAQILRSNTLLDSVREDESRYLFYYSDFTESKYSISSDFNHRFNSKNIFTIGVRADYFSLMLQDSVKVSGEDRYNIMTNTDGNFTSLRGFTELKHRFTDKLSAYTGAHFLFFDINNDYNIEPRFALNWELNRRHTLNFGLGMHSQLPTHIAFFMRNKQNDGTVLYSNKQLEMIKSNQAVLGYEVFPVSTFRIKTELYYQALSNVPVSEEFPWFSLLNEGAGFATIMPDSMTNKGTGENYGVEITAEKLFRNNYYFLMTASFYESKYKGYDGIERNSVFNGNFVLNALGGYEFKTGANSALAIDLRTVWAGGQRIMPIDLEASVAEGEAVYIYENAFENRYDDYIKLDVRISFKLNNKKSSHEWGLDLQNVTNRKNIFRQAYNPRAEDLQTDYQTGFFPMMLYRFRF